MTAADGAGAAAIIDVHCHTFNADDVPVRGFIRRVAFHDGAPGDAVAQLVDRVIQDSAPGYREEKTTLDRLLHQPQLPAAYEVADVHATCDIERELERGVDRCLSDLQAENPAFVARLEADLLAAEDDEAEAVIEQASPERAFAAVRRAIRWAKLFGKSRLEITRHLVKTYGGVNLFCPILVDLEMGLGDRAKTTIAEQVELQEKISRLSMIGPLDTDSDARVHPLAGFDPRRELRARIAEDIETPLETVRRAVERYGCIGVKLYPPMGWRPIGNTASFDMTAAEAARLNAILREFYGWCEAEHVPIIAHCNASNFAHPAYQTYASPDHWVQVLREFPNLRLNLGHFGGARAVENKDGWPWKIARATSAYPHLYADVGNHRIYDDRITTPYFDMLAAMFADATTTAVSKRIMFGSDWYMLAIHPRHEEFLDSYRRRYADRFGPEAAAAFMGGRARSFLGFDDATNKNTHRLVERYSRFAPHRVPPWLATGA